MSDEAALSDEALLGTAPLGLRPDVRYLTKAPTPALTSLTAIASSSLST